MIGGASLRSRVMVTGIAVVVLTLLLVNAAVYVALRGQLHDDVSERLDDRVNVAAGFAEDFPADTVLDRLDRAGIPARLVRSGEEDLATAALAMRSGESFLEQTLALPSGERLVVAASLTDVDRNLDDLLVLQGLGTFFGASLAALLLIRTSRRALRPLDMVVDTAHAIARGGTGERLRPERTDSEIGRLAAAIDDMLDAEESALEHARRSSMFNQQFLSDAAHQLRTPLAGIRASCELLMMSPTPEERDRLLGNLVRSTERVGLLVDALLRMARIDQGSMPEGEPTDLLELCREEVDHFRGQSDDLEIVLDADGDEYEVTIDAASMREAIANLFDNACRHAQRRVDLRLRARDGEVLIAVVDDGPGMDEATATRAFERFATFSAGHGAGLGLPIARGIVEAHGGKLVYEDNAFVIRLPIDAGT